MKYINKAIENSMDHICIAQSRDPGTLGVLREQAVLSITATFGVTSKTIIQRHLELTREGVNKLVNRMKKKQLLTIHNTFANVDKSFITLTSLGIREAEHLLNRELHLRADVSKVNERNLIHDLSVQIVILDLAKEQKITGFASERDIAIQLENRGNDQRLIDAIVMDSDTGSLIAIEMETSNSKNKSNSDLRLKILSKYLQELENTHGLYEFVYMYSHRQRFLTQIEKAHSRIFATGKHKFTRSQQDLLTSRIKFKATECNTIYDLMFNTNRPLGDDKLALIRKYKYFDKLTELEMLAKGTDDRVLQIKIEAFKEAGIVIGLID